MVRLPSKLVRPRSAAGDARATELINNVHRQLSLSGVSAAGNGDEVELQELLGEGSVSHFSSTFHTCVPHLCPPSPLFCLLIPSSTLQSHPKQFGKVYRGLWRGRAVAVKSMLLPTKMNGSEKRERMAVMEAAISSSLQHPNIVQVGSVHACMWAEMAVL